MTRSNPEAHARAAADAVCELRLLGVPALAVGERVIALSPKDAALLALAALAGPIRADRVAALLWPAASARRADTSLRQRLYRLRRAAAGQRGRTAATVARNPHRPDSDARADRQ